jgi:phage/plasmid-like protein (TIGR03299 family)
LVLYGIFNISNQNKLGYIMAHAVEMINGQAQMAYRESKGLPWHGLGTPVSDDMTPREMQKAAGLDWEVEKVDTFIRYKGDNVATGQQALVRSTDGKILTQVGKGWNPVQNSEAFDFFTDFVSSGDMQMDTAGSLKDGQIVWALADVKDGFQLFGGDEVKGYLLFSNPHHYGKSIDIKFVMERVVCNNTLSVALNEVGQPSVRVNHRSVFNPESVKEILGLGHNRVEQFKEAAEFLGSKRYTDEKLTEFFGVVFGKSTKEKEVLARTAKEAMSIVENQPGHEFAPGTWWNAYNAVTYMTDHKVGRTADSRMASAWFGVNAKRKVDALTTALEMAG